MDDFKSEWTGNKKEDLKEGNYFIIDWVVNNPMKPNVGTPRIIVANATSEDVANITAGKILIPSATVGAKYRVTLKVDKLTSL